MGKYHNNGLITSYQKPSDMFDQMPSTTITIPEVIMNMKRFDVDDGFFVWEARRDQSFDNIFKPSAGAPDIPIEWRWFDTLDDAFHYHACWGLYCGEGPSFTLRPHGRSEGAYLTKVKGINEPGDYVTTDEWLKVYDWLNVKLFLKANAQILPPLTDV